VMPPDGTPAANYRTIREELYNYSPVLAERDEVIVLNKMDLLEDDAARAAAVKSLRSELKLGREVEVMSISAAARMNTRDLLQKLWTMLNAPERTWQGADGRNIDADDTELEAVDSVESKSASGRGSRSAKVGKSENGLAGKVGVALKAGAKASAATKKAGAKVAAKSATKPAVKTQTKAAGKSVVAKAVVKKKPVARKVVKKAAPKGVAKKAGAKKVIRRSNRGPRARTAR
ncbi:MAG: hypothetical protein K2X32_15310, partial [Phycisphaerales bacterium]|nr:hypothetical protein [Phycisphaerales bacterium]